MTATLRGTRHDEPVDPAIVGAQMLNFVERHIGRMLAFCNSDLGSLVTHVDYYRLIDDPAVVMADVHRALETYGLDAEAAADRFGGYMRAFDIPREEKGLKRGG